MEEHLDLLVYPFHNFCSKDTVSCKGLVVLTLEAINLTRLCCHRSGEGTFRSKVIPVQPHKVSGDVVDLLGHGNQIDVLIQELARFVLGE